MLKPKLNKKYLLYSSILLSFFLLGYILLITKQTKILLAIQFYLLITIGYKYFKIYKKYLLTTDALKICHGENTYLFEILQNGDFNSHHEIISIITNYKNNIYQLKNSIPYKQFTTLEFFMKDSSHTIESISGELSISTNENKNRYFSYTATKANLINSKIKVLFWIKEITSIKQQELSLTKYLNHYRTLSFELENLIDLLPIAIWKRKINGDIVLYNQEYLNLSNKIPELERKHILNTIKNNLSKKLKKHPNQTATYDIALTLNNKRYNLKCAENIVYNTNYSIGYIMEIVESLSITSKYTLVNDVLATVQNNISYGVLIINKEGYVEMANQAFIDFFSLEHSMFNKEISFSSLLDKIQEKGLFPETNDYKAFKDQYSSYLKSSNNADNAFYVHLSNNIVLQASVVNSKNKSTIFIYEDVTKLINAERAYKDLLLSFRASAETSINPIAIFDEETSLKFYNAAFMKLFKNSPIIKNDNCSFKKIINIISSDLESDKLNQELTLSIIKNEEKLSACTSLKKETIKILFKPLPDKTILVRFYPQN